MPRYILVPTHGTDAEEEVFAAALALARAFAGHIAFLHVRLDAERDLLATVGPTLIASRGGPQVLAHLARDVAERCERAERSVRDFCARKDIPFEEAPGAGAVSAEWIVRTGEEENVLPIEGRVADLLVMGRGTLDVSTMDVLEAALLRAGQPILIAAKKPLELDHATIAIAWKDTRETARAVAASRPFLAKAARVSIFTVEEERKGQEKPGERLLRALRWHNPGVTLETLTPDSRPPVETLLDAVSAFGANLLVMGGYSHSRAREVLFGGFTRRVLRGAELPVLMAR